MMVVACQASCVMAPFRHKLNRLFTRNTLLLFSDMLLHCGTLTKVKEPGLKVSMNNFEINKHNHNYNKIVKSDWLSTALISALIGQFNRTVRVVPN